MGQVLEVLDHFSMHEKQNKCLHEFKTPCSLITSKQMPHSKISELFFEAPESV